MQYIRAIFTNHRLEIVAGFLDITLGILHPLQPIVSRTVVQFGQSIDPCTLFRRRQFSEAHQSHTNALLYESAHQFLGIRPDATHGIGGPLNISFTVSSWSGRASLMS